MSRDQIYETLLSRLGKIKPAALRANVVRAHRASCPVCGSGNGLSVALTDSGVILAKCFSEDCAAVSVLAAVGMDAAALFPPRGVEHFARGNGGPACWAGAAGAAAALEDAAIDLATGGGSVFLVMEKASAFKRLARAAMRADASRAKGAA